MRRIRPDRLEAMLSRNCTCADQFKSDVKGYLEVTVVTDYGNWLLLNCRGHRLLQNAFIIC